MGLLSKLFPKKDGEQDGPCETYFENGQLRAKGNYKDGELHGPYAWYYENGQLEWKGRYKDGEFDGPSEEYHENGQLEWKGTYKDGEFDGPSEEYHENGQLEWKGTYKDGETHGPVERYHENGQLKSKVTFKDGKLDGPSEEYHENGQLRWKRRYKDGELDGPSEEYHENGQLEWKGTYKEGEFDGPSEEYHENGQLRWKRRYKDGELDGPSEEYHENGQLEWKGTYKEGEFDGPSEEYHENGQLRWKRRYKDGELDGPSEFYHENGQLSWKGTLMEEGIDGPCGASLEDGQIEEKGAFDNIGQTHFIFSDEYLVTEFAYQWKGYRANQYAQDHATELGIGSQDYLDYWCVENLEWYDHLSTVLFLTGKRVEQDLTDKRVEQNLRYAVWRLQDDADKGDLRCCRDLALLYFLGKGVEQNLEEAAHWFRLAADKGDPLAQLGLGLLLGKDPTIVDESTSEDLKGAAYWLRLAADQDNALAQLSLGFLYCGVPVALEESSDEDLEEGAHWFRLAANQGDRMAQYNLGVLYLTGKGVPEDKIRAYKLCSLAAHLDSLIQIANGNTRDSFSGVIVGVRSLIGQIEPKLTQDQIHIIRNENQEWISRRSENLSLIDPNHEDIDSIYGAGNPIDLPRLVMEAIDEGSLLVNLNQREALILQMYWGLTEGGAKTYEEIGLYFGVTRERIRQLLNRGSFRLQKLAVSHDGKCRRLLTELLDCLQPLESGAIQRARALVDLGLPHLSVKQAVKAILTFIPKLTQSKTFHKWHHDDIPSHDWVLYKAAADALSAVDVADSKDTAEKKDWARLYLLMNDVVWPRRGNKTRPLQGISPVRKIDDHHSFMSQKNGRPVHFESGLEEEFFRRIEKWPNVINYCEQPLWIEVPKLGHKYCPDCLVTFQDDTQVIIEIKPLWLMVQQTVQFKWSALGDFANAQGVGRLMTDGRRTLSDIEKHIPPDDYCSAVLEELRNGPMWWAQYENLKEDFKPSGIDLAALILRENLVWSLNPFRLSDSYDGRNNN